jgi:hypothetical protein
LHGGNAGASNYSTPFGGSQGLLWNWSGPRGFTAAVQTPLADTVSGSYQLTVTEVRNGCTAIATNVVDFSVLTFLNPALRGNRGTTETSFHLTNNGFTGASHLIVNTSVARKVTLVIHNTTGAPVYNRTLSLQKGQNDILLPSWQKNRLHVLSLYIDNQLRFTKKAIL